VKILYQKNKRVSGKSEEDQRRLTIGEGGRSFVNGHDFS
jgi:hypothetical protein